MKRDNNFVCFYTSRPFWTGKKPDFKKIVSNQNLFNIALSERTIEYNKRDFYIAFCKDGLIMTKIKILENVKSDFIKSKKHFKYPSPEMQYTSEYLSYLNTLQLLLDSALLKTNNLGYFNNNFIGPETVFKMHFENNNFKGSGIPKDLTKYFYLGRFLNEYKHPVEFDTRFIHREELEKKVFDTCCSDFSKVIRNNEAIKMLNIASTAISEYKNLNFKQALIHSWFIIEYFINKRWVNFLLTAKKKSKHLKKINSNRRKILLGKDFTSSIMSNILELNGIIPFEIFENINDIRNKRNIVVHNLDLLEKLSDKLKESPQTKKNKSISIDDCGNAFDIIKYFLEAEYKIKIVFNTGYSYSPL